MNQSGGLRRGAWFWVGVILLSNSALFWLFLILGLTMESENGEAVLGGIIITIVPIGIGTYCIIRNRKAPATGMARANQLANLTNTEEVESLIRLLRHKDESVRRQATEALGKVGDTRAIKPLTRALKDDSFIVQEFAKEAIAKIKTKYAVDNKPKDG